MFTYGINFEILHTQKRAFSNKYTSELGVEGSEQSTWRESLRSLTSEVGQQIINFTPTSVIVNVIRVCIVSV